MAINDVFRLSARGEYQGQDIVNVWYYVQTNIVQVGGDEELLFNAWQNEVQDNYVAAHPSAWFLIDVRIQKVFPNPDGAPFLFIPTPPVQGGQAGSPMPGQVALIFTLRTLRPGRRGRGRTYFAPLAEADFDGGILNDPPPAHYTALANDFIGEITSAGGRGYQMVVFSSTGESEAEPQPWSLVQLVNLQQIVGTQRRRRIGVGS